MAAACAQPCLAAARCCADSKAVFGARAPLQAAPRRRAARCCASSRRCAASGAGEPLPKERSTAEDAPSAAPPAAPRRTPLITPDASRRRVLFFAAAAAAPVVAPRLAFGREDAREGHIQKTDAEWKASLPPQAYRVLRHAATEAPFTSPLNNEKRVGTFTCAGCGAGIFPSNKKFDSGTGWPSFRAPLPGALREVPDFSLPFLPRAEVRCAQCEGHLGHVFDDGPPPEGTRFCINGAALGFQPAETAAM